MYKELLEKQHQEIQDVKALESTVDNDFLKLTALISFCYLKQKTMYFSVARVIFVKRSDGHACVDVTK